MQLPHASLTAQLAKGERKESHLIDLAAEEDWLKDVLRQKIQTIRDEHGRIRHQLEQTTNQLEADRQTAREGPVQDVSPDKRFSGRHERAGGCPEPAGITRMV